MFGLSIKERLFKEIISESKKESIQYKKNLIINLQKFNQLSEDDCQQLYASIRRDYLWAVCNKVFTSLNTSSATIAARIQMAIIEPSLCGYPDMETYAMMAGSLFAICYWAMKNKPAKAKDCIYLNHMQNFIMNSVLEEIESVMS